MDLTTVKTKLHGGEYKSAQDFAVDIKLIWNNCMKYNKDGSDLFKMAQRSNKAFDKAMKTVLKDKNKRKSGGSRYNDNRKRSNVLSEKGVSVDQKANFCRVLYQLTEKQLGTVIDSLYEKCPDCLTTKWKREEEDYGEEEVEVNIDKIDYKSFMETNKLVEEILNP